MIDLVMHNKKLTGRGLRILAEASGAPLSSAEHALRQSGHNLRVALVMLKKKVSAKAAAQLLRAAENDLRAAMSSRRSWPAYRPAPAPTTLRRGGN
jgi:N-acetylmuramic acid 6-phosphate etherase